MKSKSWITYLLIIILIIFVASWGVIAFRGYRDFTIDNEFINPFIFQIIFYSILGLLFGLEHLIQEIKKIGKWRINIPKLVLLGIPSLYFSFGYLLYFGLSRILPQALLYPLSFFVRGTPSILPVFQILFGYTMITVFIKDELKQDS